MPGQPNKKDTKTTDGFLAFLTQKGYTTYVREIEYRGKLRPYRLDQTLTVHRQVVLDLKCRCTILGMCFEDVSTSEPSAGTTPHPIQEAVQS